MLRYILLVLIKCVERVFRPRDFVLTSDGLVFAVTSYVHPPGFVLGFLRFVPSNGGFKKLGTTRESYQYLQKHHPELLHPSKESDALLQAIPMKKIKRIMRPDEFLRKLKPEDEIKVSLLTLSTMISCVSGVNFRRFGATGSVLIGASNKKSDIDLVVYGMHEFNQVRDSIASLKRLGVIAEPSGLEWRERYERRLPSRELSFKEYVWHEKRKFNYGVFRGRRFDLLYVRDYAEMKKTLENETYQKLGTTKVKAKITDDSKAFDYPARFKIETPENPEIKEIACYTHTYTGQTQTGETVEAQGVLEKVQKGKKTWHRIFIGTGREAKGEYIKVVK